VVVNCKLQIKLRLGFPVNLQFAVNLSPFIRFFVRTLVFAVCDLDSVLSGPKLLSVTNPEAFQFFAEGGGIDQKQLGRFLLVPISLFQRREDQSLFVAPHPVLER